MKNSMSEPEAILVHAQRLGLRLQVEGERIAIAPAHLCTSEMLAAIRRHKPEIISLIETGIHSVPPDCGPWLHVARQVLAGELDGADRSTAQSLTIGLRGIWHPLCQRALRKIQE